MYLEKANESNINSLLWYVLLRLPSTLYHDKYKGYWKTLITHMPQQRLNSEHPICDMDLY